VREKNRTEVEESVQPQGMLLNQNTRHIQE
jgi:hypothetical protein